MLFSPLVLERLAKCLLCAFQQNPAFIRFPHSTNCTVISDLLVADSIVALTKRFVSLSLDLQYNWNTHTLLQSCPYGEVSSVPAHMISFCQLIMEVPSLCSDWVRHWHVIQFWLMRQGKLVRGHLSRDDLRRLHKEETSFLPVIVICMW